MVTELETRHALTIMRLRAALAPFARLADEPHMVSLDIPGITTTVAIHINPALLLEAKRALSE